MDANFNKNYAAYYNLLYRDKNYGQETDYVDSLIKKYSCSEASSLLNLGCGTGNHDFLLADMGYSVTGVDLSASMVEIARGKIGEKNKKIKFFQGDIRELRLRKKFDVVTSLFHVMSYQNSNEDVLRTMKTAKIHLRKNGLFIFDCWNGPGVLRDLPATREKELEDEAIKVKRLAVPVIHYKENIVDVNFKLTITNKKTGEITPLEEKHPMRYFFTPELRLFFSQAGFTLLDCFAWLSSTPPDENSWNAVYILKCV